MQRREFLQGAALAAAGATVPFPMAAASWEPEPAEGSPLGKIALEEHFMTPDFMGYFAETYQNISPELVKQIP